MEVTLQRLNKTLKDLRKQLQIVAMEQVGLFFGSFYCGALAAVIPRHLQSGLLSWSGCNYEDVITSYLSLFIYCFHSQRELSRW